MKIWYTYKQKLYSAVQKSQILKLAEKLIDLEIIIVSKVI